MQRRSFVATTGAAVAGSMLVNPMNAFAKRAKRKVVMVGTGSRGIGFWGKRVVSSYGDDLEFVGLHDVNKGRMDLAKNEFAPNAKMFDNFDDMLDKTKPDLVIVTTMDSTHHEFVIKSLNKGYNVLTEKPMTTDDVKCQAILDAERKSGKKVIVGFNYRYSTLATAIKQQLADNVAGKLTSVDFHWYLNVYHGADYFRRWHRLVENSGSLWVHKASHHFDLLNWWIDSDPIEVVAFGELEHYGNNHTEFKHTNCRPCPHKSNCKFYWDMTKSKNLMSLYADNEKYDGYLRDGCVWKDDINIYDKMSAQIKYANGVVVNYSLTTYSPYEGWRVAFNGMEGRLDSWEDIPWQQGKDEVDQANRHELEMTQGKKEEAEEFDQMMVMKNFADYQQIKVPRVRAGHGGGDSRLQDRIFKDPNAPDPLRHAAGSRDGAMAVLIGVAARKSIEQGNKKIKIADLTDLKPSVKRL
ncbi:MULTISPECIES: Gfo/Idh/MocA family protein [unclassified Imperialibacter]|uniref:Gfo/Idh/MocA family oxidoreductase n=1 Tax=unclassified Imperialibacter TaxID=2629706 RepID=UPI001259F0BC|nr:MULTISPECIES: Gfo/Idh/MocA family oxidoreductase [unclassified Imperialibacter]CAD5266700.1 4,5-dihydroxyphthalate dehydrogenase [Imperialibacter sp. 75]CAD5297315.1 4,5-dihydroxyphthalate dehydrogenase [Imperialibacter sp. 89]VVT27069.1 4,5-dihydroxyphthalate dehydrogenase [Imperialibacter sp. EC-SDR9]